jgi:hypothetical protein
MSDINPDYYKKGDKQVFEMMLDIWGVEKYIAFCEMNAFKYRMRLGDKPDQPVEKDLAKAKWYETMAKKLRAENKKEVVTFTTTPNPTFTTIQTPTFTSAQRPVIGGLSPFDF